MHLLHSLSRNAKNTVLVFGYQVDRRLYDKATTKSGKPPKVSQATSASFSPSAGPSEPIDHIGMNTRLVKQTLDFLFGLLPDR